ncbi:hypothetical protein ACFFLM_22110 [Deinococcus oregonensis]|uniref:Uncharacterized protein n=1 Tax=Deinococcus oregonensis TaxID=1805970 RepID=A0ABV6B4H9_9DEIO
MNEDERFGRHVEPPKDWDEVEAHPTEVGPEEMNPFVQHLHTPVRNPLVQESSTTSTASLPSKGVQTLQQNRFFVVAIALIVALVIMLFVLL